MPIVHLLLVSSLGRFPWVLTVLAVVVESAVLALTCFRFRFAAPLAAGGAAAIGAAVGWLLKLIPPLAPTLAAIFESFIQSVITAVLTVCSLCISSSYL
jgi:hypothetical protein